MSGNSIYVIQRDLLEVLEKIEELDGELTPELEEQLTINQDELEEAMSRYHSTITLLNSQIEACKIENKRISARIKSLTSSVDRLKSYMIEAINTFGDYNNKGKISLSYPTITYSIRNSEKTIVNKEFIERMINKVDEYVFNCKLNNTEVYIDSTIDSINNDLTLPFYNDETQEELDNRKITANDLACIEANVIIPVNIANSLQFYNSDTNILKWLSDNNITFELKDNTTATNLKPKLTNGESKIGFIEINENLNVK